MQSSRKCLLVMVVMAFLWLQTTQVLLAQDTPESEDSQGFGANHPFVSDANNAVSVPERAKTLELDIPWMKGKSPWELVRASSAFLATEIRYSPQRLRNWNWTRWVSEENNGPPSRCSGQWSAAAGFGCSGGWCDNVRLLCYDLPDGVWLAKRYGTTQTYWTSWFSEEGKGNGYDTYGDGWYPYRSNKYDEVCHADGAAGVVVGIRCSGSSCDNIKLQCAVPVNSRGYPAKMTACEWRGWVSEEQGSLEFLKENLYITGVSCRGSSCDDKKFYVCSIKP